MHFDFDVPRSHAAAHDRQKPLDQLNNQPINLSALEQGSEDLVGNGLTPTTSGPLSARVAVSRLAIEMWLRTILLNPSLALLVANAPPLIGNQSKQRPRRKPCDTATRTVEPF